MKLCFVDDAAFLGGGERWIARTASHLVMRGHQVSVACRDASSLASTCTAAGLDVFGYAGGLDTREFASGFRRFLDEREVDLVHCTIIANSPEAVVLDRIAARVNSGRRHAPLAVVLKTGLPPVEQWAPRTYGAGAGPSIRRLHVVSPILKDAFESWQPAMHGGYVEIAPEGVDLQRFSPTSIDRTAARRRWEIADDAIVVACVARLDDAMKGQSVLLRALTALRRRHARLVALVAGDGDDRQLLEQLSCDLGLADVVRFIGHVDDVRTVLRAADLLCHPSLNDGIPNAVLEAIAMGTPVVASRVGGLPDVIDDGVTGVFVPPNDVASLQAALGALIDDAPRRERMAASAREHIVARFDFTRHTDRLAERFAEEVAELAEKPRRRNAPPVAKVAAQTRVLFLFNHLRTGGEETEVAILARHLHDSPYVLSVLSCAATNEACPALEKLAAWQVDVDVACHSMPTDRAKERYIASKIHRERIAIVVACQDASLAYRAFALLDPKECRLIEHGGVLDDVHRIPKDRTARYVGVSNAIAADAASVMRVPSHALFVPSMVDADEYDAPEWADARSQNRRWLIDTILTPYDMQNACIVACAGRLDERKRFHDLVAAARRVVRHANVVFVVLGGADAFQPGYAQWLFEQAADLVKAGRLHFLGPRGDLPGLLAACHVLVHPAVGEGMAHVINEAGAAGLAVIATDDGAAREQLDDGACGLLVPPGDVDALSRAIERLVTNVELRNDLGRRLKARVLARYEARAVSARWKAIFRDVVKEMDNREPSPPVNAHVADDNAACLAHTRLALRDRLARAPGSELLCQYIERGKMIRADVLFAASACVGGRPDQVLLAAQAVELLHTASLFHDDIIDQASERRGLPSLHHRVGVGSALVLGDALLVRAVSLLAEARGEHPAETVFRALTVLHEAAQDCSRGQIEELEASPWISEEEYESIARGKTGAPFAAAAMLGAVFGGGRDAEIERLRIYGDALGIAFQIADDLLDVIGESAQTGKPAGNSLRQRRPMLPLIYLWRSGPPSIRNALRELEERDWPRGELLGLMREQCIFEQVRDAQERHLRRAVDALDIFGKNSGAARLRDVARQILVSPTMGWGTAATVAHRLEAFAPPARTATTA